MLSINDEASKLTGVPHALALHSVDFFKAGILKMDPFVFGRISAIHAISDLYAMGASPENFQPTNTSGGVDGGGGGGIPRNASCVALPMCSVPLAADKLMAADFKMMMAGARYLCTQKHNRFLVYLATQGTHGMSQQSCSTPSCSTL